MYILYMSLTYQYTLHPISTSSDIINGKISTYTLTCGNHHWTIEGLRDSYLEVATESWPKWHSKFWSITSAQVYRYINLSESISDLLELTSGMTHNSPRWILATKEVCFVVAPARALNHWECLWSTKDCVILFL